MIGRRGCRVPRWCRVRAFDRGEDHPWWFGRSGAVPLKNTAPAPLRFPTG
ncbi:hypothetical protein APASM_1900 [Actinosynnema pretiosum subsp. pretiosum]|nr:hypothetical protein APASM_1900 [Actinosynnema pretiosum subsp. pretiosum]